MGKSLGQRRAWARTKLPKRWDARPNKRPAAPADDWFRPRRVGPLDLVSYIRQQRAARSHKMKITLAKKWEG